MYHYTTAVFAVGLEGFAEVDNERITAMAADGWEPLHMAPVHNGFAAVVLFRREGAPPSRPTARATTARTRKTPAKTAPARAQTATRRARRT